MEADRREHTARLVECRRCPRLVAWREGVPARAAFAGEAYWRRPVPGFGDPHASVVVVGLAPAAHGANRTGRMFTGDRSGDWLYRAMWRAGFASQPESISAADGLSLEGAWVTAAVRCAPPDNKPTTAERDTCMAWLRAELRLLCHARVLVALGGFAWDALTVLHRLSPKPRFAHMAEVQLAGGPAGRPAGGPTMLGSYHPSQQNTFTGRLTEPMLDAVFVRARELAGG